jgi:hypothetical protein
VSWKEENDFFVLRVRDFRAHKAQKLGFDSKILKPKGSWSIPGVDLFGTMPKKVSGYSSQTFIGFSLLTQKGGVRTGEKVYLLSGKEKT